MVQHIRRNPRKLPSVRKHGLSALLLLAILGLSVMAWLNISAKNPPIKHVAAEVLLPKPMAQNPTNTTPPLPDLLKDDNIPQNVNPTDQISMVGGPAETVNAQSRPHPQPRTNLLMIDGRTLPSRTQSIRNYTPLLRAPIDGMSQMTPYGRVPHPHKDGRTALSAYAKPFTPKAKTKYISLVVGGLGLNPSITRKAINNLPGTVTLSFAAEAPGLQGWVNQARARGHEVMIELPMQGSEPIGTRTLISGRTDMSNVKNLEYLLSRAQGYFAVTNYDGGILIKDETALLPIVKRLKEAGLGFVYDGGIAENRLAPLAKREGLAYISGTSYLDEERHDASYVMQNIKILHEDSYENTPIGMGFAYEGTIDGIRTWLAAKPKNIEIAPVSYALKKG